MKYPGAIAGIFIVFSHFLRNGWNGIKDYKFYLSVAIIPIFFLVGTPYALLDYPTFSEQFFSQFGHYSQGHTGMEGNALIWYLQYAWNAEGFINLFSLLGIIYGFYKKDKPLIILSSFTIIYFAFISSFQVRNDRTFLPLTPFLFIYASYLGVSLKEHLSKINPKAGPLVIYLIFTIGLGYQGYKTIVGNKQFITPNSRETAVPWIQENIPTGSKIAIEPYAPFIEPSQFEVAGMGPIIDHEPNGIRRMVSNTWSSAIGCTVGFTESQRNIPIKSKTMIASSMNLKLVKEFNDGGYEVKIYQVSE